MAGFCFSHGDILTHDTILNRARYGPSNSYKMGNSTNSNSIDTPTPKREIYIKHATLPYLTGTLHSLITSPTTAILMRDINLVRYHNRTRRRRFRGCRSRRGISLESLHLDVRHHPLLALRKGHVNGVWICTPGPALTFGIVAAAANAPETARGRLGACFLG